MYARAQWNDIQHLTIESFKGAAFISFVFGCLAASTSGILSQIFSSGIIEHIAKITLPLFVMSGFILTGLATLLRRKFKNAFYITRHLANSCLIVCINLFSVVSGLCFGLTLPGAFANGWGWLFAWPFYGSLIYLFALICHQSIIINYSYHNRSKRHYIYAAGTAIFLVGAIGLVFSLQEAAVQITQSSNNSFNADNLDLRPIKQAFGKVAG